MSINFTKAIELQTVRKLKSHAKVGYQDHPRGDKYCSNCTMFVAGNPPACTHVAPPIAAQGYCDDHEPVDPNQRAKDLLAGISRDAIVPVDNKSLIDANAPKMVAKSFADVMKDELHQRVFGKAFNPDEPRDERGMWTSEGGGISASTAITMSDMAGA